MKLRILPRTLHFKQPAGTSRGVYRERKVWYVLWKDTIDGKEVTGVGECAPLYDLSCDYTPDYEEKLRAACTRIEHEGILDKETLRSSPSILFGLETAERSARGDARYGDYRLLFPSDFTQSRRGIRINGLVWMGTFEEMKTRMEEKLRSGFACVKLKIGAIGFDEEIELIKKLRQRYPSDIVELRVDANGGFTPEEAPKKLDILSRYDIHSIEQPIRQGQWRDMAHLCRNSAIPIALDEELIGVNDSRKKVELLEEICPQYIILKPTLHGGLSGAEEWMQLARERKIAYWATSALESNIGLNAIAQWSAETAFSTGMPQGLGTGLLFEQNVEDIPLRIDGDELWYNSERQRDFQKEVDQFEQSWNTSQPSMSVHTSGSTGKPKPLTVGKEQMVHSAQSTIDFLGLQPGMSALLCMPVRYIAGQMMCVRSFVGHLNLQVSAPSSHPFAHIRRALDFAALTAMQVYETLQVPREKRLLRRTRCLIIGGGSLSAEIENQLKGFPNEIWSTYGMTETLSHIAMRRVNGPEASSRYTPLHGVEISLSSEGTLTIYAPAVNNQKLLTNDLAIIHSDGTFSIIGRRDNVICSGGIKLQIEEIEQKLAPLPYPFQITAATDVRLGEAVTILFQGTEDDIDNLKNYCNEHLTPYERPRYYLVVRQLPLTDTGKPARAEAKRLAQSILS